MAGTEEERGNQTNEQNFIHTFAIRGTNKRSCFSENSDKNLFIVVNLHLKKKPYQELPIRL
jgi:hypothetical protein